MFTINQGFDLNSPQFNFKRDYFATVADLKAADENGFPDHFITNVGGVLYQLTKSNSVDTTTGKWRKVSVGGAIGTDSNIAYTNKTNSFKSPQVFNSSISTQFVKRYNGSTFLKASEVEDQSYTKLYNTKGTLTDVSVYAKSDTVSNTYAAKNKAFGSVVKTTKAGYVGLEFKYVNGSSEGINNIDILSATTTESGVMSADDKKKLDGIAANANNYTLPTASTTVKGGVQLGYTATDKNYPLNVDSNGKAYVNVPWTDTKTDISNCAKLNAENIFSKSNVFAEGFKINDGLVITQSGSNQQAVLNIQNLLKASGAETANPAGISTNGGTANKLFASDGSLFDASTLATKTSLGDYVSNQGGRITTNILDNGNTLMTISGDSTNGNGGYLFINGTSSNGFSIPRITLNGASGNIEAFGTVTAKQFIKSGGTASQFLKADGSVDNNTYVKTSDVTAITEDEINALF